MIEVMSTDRELMDAAIALIETRLADEEWAGAAAMRLDDGSILTSTAPESLNASVNLCHETGALCEAYRRDRTVVASICVVRPDERGYVVLAPCGVCQERLFLYGPDVEVAVADEGSPDGWRWRRLGEAQPYHWRDALRPTD